MIVIVFALFFIPVVSAWILNVVRPDWLPIGRTNNGDLVEPPRLLAAEGLGQADGTPLPVTFFADKWTLVHWVQGPCEDACKNMLVQTRQARIALGKDFERVQRLVLSEQALPETTTASLSESHPGLAFVTAPPGWSKVLDDASTGISPVSLVDPQGYFMLRYNAHETASRMLKDLKRLLKLSKIG